MTLQEIRNKKKNLEDIIHAMIEQFYKETGIEIINIRPVCSVDAYVDGKYIRAITIELEKL